MVHTTIHRQRLPVARAICGWLLLAGALTAAPHCVAATFEDAVAAEGRGDLATAVADYRSAAERDEAPAEFALGRLYLGVGGISPDLNQAYTWFQKAAEQGNPGAEFELGVMLRNGQGAKRDLTASAAWFSKAALRGYAPAETNLAIAYGEGAGVDLDINQAIAWATLSAEQGEEAGQVELAKLYLRAAQQPALPRPEMSARTFREMMDRVFGPGSWRLTGGYRTPARENALRAEGAGTVSLGQLSRHSMGTPQSPGAYDVVVAKMTPAGAAARLLGSGAHFRRVFPEGAHGAQGPHIHVEPLFSAAAGERSSTPSGSLLDAALSGAGSVAPATPADDRAAAEHWARLAAASGSDEAIRLLANLHAEHPDDCTRDLSVASGTGC